MSDKPVFAYAMINARVMPIDRGEMYEDPLMEALEENGFAEITGGGTMQSDNGEIEYCGIDLDLFNLEEGIPFICDFLGECGAPQGSKLQYKLNGEDKEVPFGFLEGLAIYFNGTDLPAEVYENNDINDLYDEINERLGERGQIQGHWNGPEETAMYLYGYSVEEMRELIASLMSTNPLCEKVRYETIA